MVARQISIRQSGGDGLVGLASDPITSAYGGSDIVTLLSVVRHILGNEKTKRMLFWFKYSRVSF